MGERIKNWQVDFGDGETHAVSIPHAWRQDVDVRFEGPAVYSTSIQVPAEPASLWFEGISYEAVVSIEGEIILTHCGIWDSFELPLLRWRGRNVQVQVAVTKNGGPRFPVKDVASGFLPFVFHTFGGIWGRVEVREQRSEVNGQGLGEGYRCLESGPPPCPPPTRSSHGEARVCVEGSRIFVDGRPFYVRGLLHWGWYPELGHHNPPDETIRQEVREAKKLGFNLVKFCLWVPTHRYLEILREEGMEAWLELPLWDPTSDPEKLSRMGNEIETIVRQYAHHDNIIVWTVGCELSQATPPEFRQYMVQLVKNLTGSPLVKDNSGGAEMYGGDLREFGDFFDFHPYCDTPFYPAVLDSLLPGPRKQAPILLGEFNDVDVHRDLTKIHDELPYWASSLPELNDQGVRWQHDLPNFVRESPIANGDELERHTRLMESSRGKALFMRKLVHEWVRARDPISGYVVTGWRDTPISTAGFFDDWGRSRFSSDECSTWNGPNVLFLIPTRRPPWVDGGNRPGWLDVFNYFVGQVFMKVGIHSEFGLSGGLVWKILNSRGEIVARGAEESLAVSLLSATQVAEISWETSEPGGYELQVEFGGATNSWRIHVEQQPQFQGWSSFDSRNSLKTRAFGEGSKQVIVDDIQAMGSLTGQSAIVLLNAVGTKPMPFWRESAYEFASDAPFKDEWERMLAVSSDCALDLDFLSSVLPDDAKMETLINRVDVRTYQEMPIMVRVKWKDSDAIFTTLRAHGGLGIQPDGLDRNPAGVALLSKMMELLT